MTDVKDLIKDLEHIVKQIEFYDGEGLNENDVETVQEAIEVLEKQVWIPVTERLPEEHEEEYQTFSGWGCDGEDVRMESDTCLVTVKDNENGELIVDGGYTINGKFPDDVIAWAPLPEPYRR